MMSPLAVPPGTLYEQEQWFRRRQIMAVLAAHKGNRTYAARALGMQRTYLLRLMRQLGIQYRPAPMPMPEREDHGRFLKVRSA